MKQIKTIFIILAGAILLLHTFLPHEHHDELKQNQNIEAHANANSLLDYIKLAFHVDLGEDHLEGYKITQHEQLNFDLILFFSLDYSFEIQLTAGAAQHFVNFEEKLHSRYYSRHLSLRGPPQTA
jgi:hypothetical protein